VSDRERDAIYASQRVYLERYNIVADLGAPLVTGKKALGILYISYLRAHTWDDEQVRLAQTFAQQVASTLSNARLVRESRIQVRDLRALARSANLIALSRSPETALGQIARDLRELLHVDYAGFDICEGDCLRIITEAHHPWANDRYPMREDHKFILEHLQKFIVTDREVDAKSEEHRKYMEMGNIVAQLGVPMVARGRPIGILHVSHSQPRQWDADEIRLVETFAQNIANVLENVQLLNEKTERVQQLEQLAELFEITATMPDEEMLTEVALSAAKNLLNADRALLIRLQDGVLQPVRTSDGVQHPIQPPPLTPILRAALETGEPLIVDPKHQLNFDAESAARRSFYGSRSLLSVRMSTANDQIGLLGFTFREEHEFTHSEIQLAQTAANQLAMAFANARLLQDQLDRIAKLNLLAEFSQVCGAIHESGLLEQTALQRIRTLLDVTAVSIRYVKGDMLSPGVSLGYHNPGARSHSIPIGPRLARVLVERKPHPIADLEQEPGLPAHWVERHRDEGFASLLMLPMLVHDGSYGAEDATGILTVYRNQPHHWGEPEIQFAQTVANTLALALSNVRQMETVQSKSDELQATLDSVFSGVFTTDREGTILSWNRAAQQITGWSPDEMMGKQWHVDGPRVGVSQRDDNIVLEAMADDNVRFSLAPRALTRPDGGVIQLREAAASLRDRAGNVRGAVCAFWDRTEELAAETAQSDFIADVMHQLGNKLGAVIMSAQRLQRSDLSDRSRRRFIDVIANTALDLETIQQRLLEFRHERVREPVQESPVDLRPLLQKHTERLRMRASRRFQVEGDFDLVLADPHRLDAVLENLLDNAVKYSPGRSRISVKASCPQSGELLLAIHNRGEPIPHELQAHLFERGRRGDWDKPGSGLGLWLVRTKLHEMSGDICFESEPRRGTTFFVSFRRKESPRPSHPGAQTVNIRSSTDAAAAEEAQDESA
jgi:PAS domain S-box-containing protein